MISREKNKFLVGSRGSSLAQTQTKQVIDILKCRFPDLQFEVIYLKTIGEKILNKPLFDLGEKGGFVKELEEALLTGDVDFVVHSLKDLPTQLPEGLVLAATCQRENPQDVLLSHNGIKLAQLPSGSRVATSSRRRIAQLSVLRKDLEFIDIRGNIQPRINKYLQGYCDAIVLAAAGLIRLGLTNYISQYFTEDEITPAAGQGALAIECRQEDKQILAMLDQINDSSVFVTTRAERALLNRLGGGCSVPVGSFACLLKEDFLKLTGCVVSLDGSEIYRHVVEGHPKDASHLGEQLAEILLTQGAGKIIETLRHQTPNAISPP